MPRRRMIDPKIWESDQVNNLSFRQRLLYIGLITMADDEGRLMNRPLIFKAKFFVNDEQVTEDMIKDDLNFLHKIQLIQIYGKKSYICHPNWAKYQRPTNSQKSDIPPPPFRLQYQFTKRQMKSGEYYGPNWLQQKKLARQRATGKCEHCGKNVTNRSLDVHHLQHFDEFSGDFVMANKLENLICLCTSCHRLAHTKGLRGQNTTKSISNIGLETTSEITPETRSLGQSSLGQVSLGHPESQIS